MLPEKGCLVFARESVQDFQSSSKEEAIAIAKRFWQLHVDVLGPSYEGAGEIRQMFHQEECSPQHRQARVPDSAQVAVVRRLYEARGNPDIIRQALAPDIRWEVVEGFPYGGVYVGLDDVLGNFFGRLVEDFENFVAAGAEFFESGDRVIALGSYSGRAKATGREFTARFTHVWTLRGGKIVRLQQCADTVQVTRALAG